MKEESHKGLWWVMSGIVYILKGKCGSHLQEEVGWRLYGNQDEAESINYFKWESVYLHPSLNSL